MIITAGGTNKTVDVYFVDDDGGTAPGEPTTGLLFSDIETGGSASYHRQGAARVDFTLVTQTVAGAHTDGGFIQIDATNMPGLYRLDVPDLAFASGADYVVIQLVAAAANNTLMRPLQIDLTTVDLRSASGLVDITQAAADKVWSTTTRTLTAFSTTLALSVWHVLESAVVTASTMGLKVKNNLDVVVSTRATPAEVKTQADTALTDIHLDHAFATNYDPAAKPGVATALFNELVENDLGVSRFTANALELAPVATGFSTHTALDVWHVLEASVVTASTMGVKVKTNLDAAMTTRAVAGDAMALTAAERNATADAHLNRDMSLVSDTNARSPLNAHRLLRNKYSIATGTLTVTKENDTTTAWTATLTTDAAANPITGSDPV